MTDDAFSLLHPGVQYHLVNTLRWDGLRPTRAAAVRPIMAGDDALVLAPTAGGQDRGRDFSLLSAMAEQDWQGTSVLYVCPLRALLNNLPSLACTVTPSGSFAPPPCDTEMPDSPPRQRILQERPDILLTTPESLEAMVVSTKVDPRALFSGLHTLVVAGDRSRHARGTARRHPAHVTLTRRAQSTLTRLRESYTDAVDSSASVVTLPAEGSGRWWTWAGTAANRTLFASLPALVDPRQRVDEKSLRLLPGVTPQDVSGALADIVWRQPEVSVNAVAGLEFSVALPAGLAVSWTAFALASSGVPPAPEFSCRRIPGTWRGTLGR